MMLVNLVFDYYTDVINVPDEIGTQIKNIKGNVTSGYIIKIITISIGKKMNMVKARYWNLQ